MPSSTSELLKFNRDKFAIESIIFRSDNKLTRDQFAKKMQISIARLCDYELKKNMPSVEVVINFCQVSGKDIYSFFDKK